MNGSLIIRFFLILFIGFNSLMNSSNQLFAQYKSAVLHYDDNMRLVYHSDQDGNRIPDFSHAGYKGGGVELPVIPVVKEIGPISGDNTAHIQAAIDAVSLMPLNEQGIRGALLLKPGLYPLDSTVYIKHSGIILRGSGQGENPNTNTVILGRGTDKRKLIEIGSGSDWNDKIANSKSDIISEFIPAGSRSFEVEDISAYKEGDNIVIYHPSTQKWIDAVDKGATNGDVDWLPGEIDMYFNRFITHIDGNKIKVDVPSFDHLDRSLSQASIWIVDRSKLITQTGIENLRVDIQTSGAPEDEKHPWDCIFFSGVEDSWVKDVTTLHFAKSGIRLFKSSHCTILDCTAINPVSVILGGRRYNFCVDDQCNNILFQHCHAAKARHAFVSNGTSSVSGIVFTGCSSVDDYTASESHRRWGEALLWDNTSLNSINTYRILSLYNRGDYGTGHGWTGTNQVAWNISAPDNQIVIQKPPIGQNYAIACNATVDNNGPFKQPVGYIEGTGETSEITSLYEAQLAERMTYGVGPDAPGKLKIASYLITDTSKYVNLTWLDIAMDESEYVLERSSDGGKTFIQIAQLTENTKSYKDEDSILEAKVYKYRLKAVNDIGSSAWSNLLSVDLSSSNNFINKVIPATEDTSIQGGASSDINFGAEPELRVKKGSVESFFRKTLIKFDLNGESSLEEDLVKAILRLYANKADYCTIIATEIDDTWTESGVAWASAPDFGNDISSATISSDINYYEWDITNYLKSQLILDGVVSVCLQDNAGSNVNVVFNSKEAADHHPELVLIVENALNLSSDYDQGFKLNFFPNPAKNVLNVTSRGSKIDRLAIYSLSGQILLSQDVDQAQVRLDIEHLDMGIYLLRVVGDFGTYTNKFVKAYTLL